MGEKLKKLIELQLKQGETTTALAKKIGISQPAIIKMQDPDIIHDLLTYLKAMRYFSLPLEEVVDADTFQKAGFWSEKSINPPGVITMDRRREDRLAQKDSRFKEALAILTRLFESNQEDQKTLAYNICKSFTLSMKPGLKKKQINAG